MTNLLQYYWINIIHKTWVAVFLVVFCLRLLWRAFKHDFSKFHPDEAYGFSRRLQRIRGAKYGTPEYDAILVELKPYISRHYRLNPHHPEHYPDGIRGMDLADIVEMFFDWKSSTKKRSDGDMIRSIGHGKTRFKMSEDLYQIFINTERD